MPENLEIKKNATTGKLEMQSCIRTIVENGKFKNISISLENNALKVIDFV
jgi:hypothetical protein